MVTSPEECITVGAKECMAFRSERLKARGLNWPSLNQLPAPSPTTGRGQSTERSEVLGCGLLRRNVSATSPHPTAPLSLRVLPSAGGRGHWATAPSGRGFLVGLSEFDHCASKRDTAF